MSREGKCTKDVWHGYHAYPCSRKAVRDGFCKQHHPDSVAAKDRAREQRFRDERKRARNIRVLSGLSDATDEELMAEVQRRGL